MPRNLKRYYGLGDLHFVDPSLRSGFRQRAQTPASRLNFVTFSCYQRRPLLGNGRRRDLVLRALEMTRAKYQMVVCGYVVMPEHVHLLVSEPGRQNLSTVIKALKQGVARRLLRRWRTAGRQGELFPGQVAPHRFWQARFYDFNVWSPRKRIEKLRYIHRNPVTRGLVARPEQWRWSSFRYYAYGEPGIVAVNAMINPPWARRKQPG